MDEAVVRVIDISKRYEIYRRPEDRLKQSLVPRLQRILPSRFRRREPYFKEFWALKSVSFSLGRGEALGILGRNGAGKSTLLQILAGTLMPTSGTVDVAGSVAALLELGSGFNPEFTGRENVYLNGILLGLPREEVDAKFNEIAAFADIGDFIEQPIKTYSSGMMVRLAFAVQAVVEPSVLIVDEALAVGDARFQRKCYERLERYRAAGGTVLFVTHDTGVIVQLCSRAMILEHGEVFDIGEPHWIAKTYHRLLFAESGEARASKSRGSVDLPSSASSVGSHEDTASGTSANANALLESALSVAEERSSNRELRYGSREVEICEVGIRDMSGTATTLLEIGKEYVFFFRVRYKIEITQPFSFGFTITNTRGIEIYGTKGGLHRCFLPPGSLGSVVEPKMRLRMRLVAGDYFLTIAVASLSETSTAEFFDMRFDALQFKVIGIPQCFTTSIVDLGAKLWYE